MLAPARRVGHASAWAIGLLGVPLATFACRYMCAEQVGAFDLLILCCHVIGLASLVINGGNLMNEYHALAIASDMIVMFYALAPTAACIVFNLVGVVMSLVLFWLYLTRPAASDQAAPEKAKAS